MTRISEQQRRALVAQHRDLLTPAMLGEADPLPGGLVRALGKGRVREACPGCSFPMPVYPGRYPSKCPVCKTPRKGSTDGEGTAS